MLKTTDIYIKYNTTEVLKGVSLDFQESGITTIIGPNGSGKSTLLKGLARLLRPKSGVVFLDGKDIHRMPTKEVASRLAILPQGLHVPEDIQVRDLVSYGRMPYKTFFNNIKKGHNEVIQWAMDVTDIAKLAERSVRSLSGGERQRVWIALALAQQTEFLLLDEPTTYLDIHHQFEVLQLLRLLSQRHRLKVIVVLHDINHALRFSDRVIVLKDGMVYRDGKTSEVINEQLILDVFQLRAKVIDLGGEIAVLPLGCVGNKSAIWEA